VNRAGNNKSALERLRIFGLVPVWVTIGVLMIGPLMIMAAVSLMQANVYGGVHPQLDFSSYAQILFDTNLFDEREFNPAYLIIIMRSFTLALGATFLALLIGFPAAYFIARQPDHRKSLLVFLITIPFWTNLLVRTFAWVIILGRGGFMDQVASVFGLIEGDESINLMYTNTAILIGLVYSYLPLMVLPLYASMEKMDVRLLEAGADLYASRFDLIRRIILPLTMPGIIGGSILVFVPCLGAFIAPDLLGGGKKLMLGSLVQLQFATSRNWPFGAAIAMMLLAIVVIALMINAKAARRHASYEQGNAGGAHG